MFHVYTCKHLFVQYCDVQNDFRLKTMFDHAIVLCHFNYFLLLEKYVKCVCFIL